MVSKDIKWLLKLGRGRDEEAEHRELLGQGKYSVSYYSDGEMSLYLCLNPWKGQPQE